MPLFGQAADAAASAPARRLRLFPIWLAAGLLLLVVWFHSWDLIRADRNHELANASTDIANLARLSQEHAERTLFSADQTLHMMLLQFHEHQGQIDLKAMAEQDVFDQRTLLELCVLDAQGVLRQSSLAFSGRIDLSERDYFRVHATPGQDAMFISRPQPGAVSGQVSLQLSRRINGPAGELLGVVVASLDPRYFTRFYDELKLGARGSAALIGLDGWVRASRTGAQEEVPAQGRATLLAGLPLRVPDERSGSFTARSAHDGVERLQHFNLLPSYPLLVTFARASDEVLAEHVQNRRRLLWNAAIGSFFLLALAALLSWYLVMQRRHSQAQAQTLLRLQDLTCRVPGMVFQYLRRPDGSGCFPFASQGIVPICGLSPAQVALDVAPLFAMVHPDDLPALVGAIDVSARTLKPWGQEFRINPDGAPRWLSCNAAPQRQADGSVLWHGYMSDVTERQDNEGLLTTLSAVVEQSPVSIVIADLDGSMVYVNPMFERITGYSRAEVIGKNPRILSSGEKSPQEYRELWATLAAGRAWDGEFHNRRKDGTLFWERARISPVLDEHGIPIHYMAIKEDITARKEADAQLRIAAIAFESQEGMFVSNAAGVMLRVNQAFSRITGYSAEEAVGKTPSLLSSGRHDPAFYADMRRAIEQDGAWEGEIWNRRKNGEIFPEWLTISAVEDTRGVVTHYVSTLTDITRRKAAEDQIKHLAFYDPLTGLPNRRLLIDRLIQAMATGTRTGCEGALLFIDLDNFKILNDTHGHGRGDLLLQQVGQRLVACVREGDTVARLGGDEYVIMLEDLSKQPHEAAAQAEVLGGKILYALNLPFDLVGNEYHITPSIGITLFADHQNSADELMKRVELAMYQAKTAGRNTLRFFDPEMQAAVNARVVLERDLRCGLQENQFVLDYQAQVNERGQLTGVEALVRWQHPTRGRVSPAEFIPLAEEAGLILPLGHWVLQAACLQLKAWAEQAQTSHLTLSVNVSAMQFHLDNFVPEVLAILAHTGAPPGRLKLELTESLLVQDVDAIIAKMRELKVHGVGFSLDDFGTGYSSLSYLKRMPLDQLKIDQSFLHEALTKPQDAAIVKAIVTLGHSLGMAVIAEGVETQAQRDFLVAQGCYSFQGYFFGRPEPVQALARFFPHG